MAISAAAVNNFRTITQVVGITTSEVYEAPIGYTGVVLLAQVTNTTNQTETISFAYREESSDTDIIRNLAIPGNDTANLLSGKLVVETGDKVTTIGSTSTGLKFIMSILETSNL